MPQKRSCPLQVQSPTCPKVFLEEHNRDLTSFQVMSIELVLKPNRGGDWSKLMFKIVREVGHLPVLARSCMDHDVHASL